MKSLFSSLLVVAFLCVTVVGCGPAPETTPKPDASTAAPADDAATTEAAPAAGDTDAAAEGGSDAK